MATALTIGNKVATEEQVWAQEIQVLATAMVKEQTQETLALVVLVLVLVLDQTVDQG